MLLELGMRPVARTGELLEHPAFLGPEAARVPKVPGGFLDPDVESIIALRPDLVIGLAGSHDGLAPALAGTAPLWVTESNSIEDSIRYLRDLGALTGRGEQAVAAEKAFRDELAAAPVDRDTTALVVFGADGTFEIGTGSYLGELLGSIYDFPWQQTGQYVGSSPYSVEEIAAVGADVVFTMDYNSDPAAPSFGSTMAQDPLWQQLAAVRDGEVHEVSADLWGNGRGTRSLRLVLGEALALTGR
jgi:iron complex transport system substrate-binding protein